MTIIQHNLVKLFAAFISMMLVLFSYYPGLTGSFMLDDLSSLPSLFTTMDSCGWWCGVMSGSTGPTGRPISLMTFAMQIGQWPFEPQAFKLVNILIHMANSVLVILIFSKILKQLAITRHAMLVAIFAGTLWAIWPLQVSSVLYVVQRMVLLSSFFVLCGVLFYLQFRARFADDWSLSYFRWFCFCAGLATFGLLGLFSKESAVLLVVYLLVLELCLFKSVSEKANDLKVFRSVCLYLPFVGLIAYLCVRTFPQAEWLYLAREFTLEERVLTQGRVMMEYLQSLLLPKASSLGLYHDDFTKSEGMFSPISTFVSWVFILATVLIACFLRRRKPLFSLAVLWFFGGHVLESTILPLELYFEHRNYLPVALLTLLIVVYAFKLIGKASKRYVQFTFSGVLVIYVAALIGLTFSQASLWGDPFRYGVVQAHEHSGSIRARTLLVDVYSKLGKVDLAYEETLKMKRDFPKTSGVIVSDVEFACFDERYTLEPVAGVVKKLEQAKFGFGALVVVGSALEEKGEGKCEAVSTEYLLEILQALKRNPVYKRKLHLIKGYEVIALSRLGQHEQAIQVYETMTLLPEHWSRYMGALATIGRLEEAIDVADRGLKVLRSKPQYEQFYKDIERLRLVVLNELDG
jgi:protein O-mannosyl-transferase